jgi:hypothetical protein
MPTHSRLAAACCLAAAAVAAPASASAQASDQWNYTAAIYGYFPTIGGTSVFPPPVGSQSASVDIGTILDNLRFAFMGSFEARKGLWGGYTDIIYMNLEASKSDVRSIALGGVVPVGVGATATFGLKGWVWTLAGQYRVVDDPDFKTDVVFGARQLNVTPKLSWAFTGQVGLIPVADRAGSRETSLNNWDAIVGAKGRVSFGDENKWYVPYYLDLGTGASKFTWQTYAGVGYSFGSWDVVGAYKYVSYTFKSGDAMEDLTFSGPAIAAVFRW